jgi:hypothetical protein
MVAILDDSDAHSAGSQSVHKPGSIDGRALDEESPLLSDPDEPKVKALTGAGTIIAVLLLGMTIMNICRRRIHYSLSRRRVYLQCRRDARHGRHRPDLL